MSVTLAPPMVLQFQNPNNSGAPAAGYKLFTYAAGTTTKQATWTDSSQVTQNANPIILDANGCAAASSGTQVWGDPTLAYKFVLAPPTDTDPPTSGFRVTDNFYFPLTLPSGVLQFSFPQTTAETTTGITPTNTQATPYVYNLSRIGLVPNSTAAATANRTALRTLFDPTKTGPVGQFLFPNTTGNDTYYIDGVIPCRDYIRIDLNGCNIQLGTQATPAVAGATGPNDSNSGVFFALNDLSIENGTITTWWNTGTQSGSGCGLQAGQRPTGNGYITFPGGEGTLPRRMSRFVFRNLRLKMNTTGGTAANAAIQILGGVQGILLENLSIDCGASTQQGVSYEFGFANAAQAGSSGNANVGSTHANNFLIRNLVIANLPSGAGVQGLTITGAYNLLVDGYYFTGTYGAPLVVNTGEASFFNPWAGADDCGAKHNIVLRNLVIYVPSNQNAISLQGANLNKNSNAYVSWNTGFVYNPGDIVFQDPNLYTCATAIASATTPPTGTGNGIADGSGTWNWRPSIIPFSGGAANSAYPNETDLLDVEIDGFSIFGTGQRTTGGSTPQSYGIYNAGCARCIIRNGTIQYVERGIDLSAEATNVVIDNVRILNNWFYGIRFDTIGQIWGSARTVKGEVRNCYIAGNSRTGAGTYYGVEVFGNMDSVLIESNRFGYESAYAGFNDATQGGGVYINSNLPNVICRGNRGAPPVGGGNTTYFNNGTQCNGCTIENASGDISTHGPWQTDIISASAQSITANSQTINTVGLRYVRVTTNGAYTGIILQAGSDHQNIFLFNESGNTITFAASGTSNVADGASSAIPANVGRWFAWDTGTGLWYRAA